MPIFEGKAPSVEGYLAGIGASSALLAGALLAFVILVGVATFESWPRPESLLPGGGGDNVTLDASTAGIREQSSASSPPDLIELLGAGGPAAPAGTAAPSSPVLPAPSVQPPAGSEIGGGGGGGGSPGGTEPPGSPTQIVQPPPAAQTTSSPNLVQQTVSSVGTTVQGTTTVFGDTLGGSENPGLGGLVGGLGQSLNSSLQGLAGSQ
jgi:hypothetical protein